MAISWTPRLLLAVILSAAACMIWMGADSGVWRVRRERQRRKEVHQGEGEGRQKAARKKRARCRHKATKSTTTKPPFLKGLTERCRDDASRANPVRVGPLGSLAPASARIGQQSSLDLGERSPAWALLSGLLGRSGKQALSPLSAPQGDNVWTPGSSAAASSAIRLETPAMLLPTLGPPGAYFFYEGRRAVTMFSVRLPSGWDVNAPSWRVIAQWKQNECGGYGRQPPPRSPWNSAAATGCMTSFAGRPSASMPATPARWVRRSPSTSLTRATPATAKSRSTPTRTWTAPTSTPPAPGPERDSPPSRTAPGSSPRTSTVFYEGVGGRLDRQADMSIWEQVSCSELGDRAWPVPA